MYIQITVDTKNNNDKPFDIRISDQHTIKSFINIVSQILSKDIECNDTYWLRVINKEKNFTGNYTLKECGITTGDRIKIL